MVGKHPNNQHYLNYRRNKPACDMQGRDPPYNTIYNLHDNGLIKGGV